ncbi:unnamed protein product [Linum trigynum]|uniref:Uncharacterized protein n=1 Tax=Linum trigynum TaxID=586398 RepID=A0AAV2CFI9_9ROSI
MKKDHQKPTPQINKEKMKSLGNKLDTSSTIRRLVASVRGKGETNLTSKAMAHPNPKLQGFKQVQSVGGLVGHQPKMKGTTTLAASKTVKGKANRSPENGKCNPRKIEFDQNPGASNPLPEDAIGTEVSSSTTPTEGKKMVMGVDME